MKNKLITLILGTAAGVAIAGAASAGTLDDVRQHGFVQCGVSQGLMGFSVPDAQNNWTGMDVDFCRAIAAAVLGDSTKVNFTPLSAKERFTALQSGEIDVLSRNTTWTMSRDTSLGLKFAGIMYYDGQGFIVNSKKNPNEKAVKDLAGATICTQSGTTTELNIADYFKSQKLEYKLLTFEKNDEAIAAYDALATSESNQQLKSLALVFAANLFVDKGDVAAVQQRVQGLVRTSFPILVPVPAPTSASLVAVPKATRRV
jgi:general L-amino acid transport system substrate-binding protein